MRSAHRKIISLLFLSLIYIFFSGFGGLTTLDYGRKVETPENMPKGNPDPSLGIVVHGNSTGIDVLADSSQNIRFSGSMNRKNTDLELLSSSSMVDRTPKKFKFIDGKHSFSSDNIYEFSMLFSYKNNQWEHIRFMPFPSVIEWVTEEKLKVYLETWAKIFQDAGWKSNPQTRQNFTLPTPQSAHHSDQYGSWATKKYEAIIDVRCRDSRFYESYIPKAERKNVKNTPAGYIVFINIYKKSEFPDSYKTERQKEVEK
ncbi:MAG: hypothetical protein ACHQJ6_04610 [Candidatus Berkiellales bacterium]